MQATYNIVRLGASVVIPVTVPGRKKPVKVHLLPGTGLPIIGGETRNGADFALCLSSYGHVLINLYEDKYIKSQHTVAEVIAPSNIAIDQFIKEKAVVFERGIPHIIANEE